MQVIECRFLNACDTCIGSPGSRKLSGATLELEGAYFDEVTDVTSQGWSSGPTIPDLKFLEEVLHIVGTTTTYSKPPVKLLAEVLLGGAENLNAPAGLLELLGTNTEDDGQASSSKDSALFFRGWVCATLVVADISGASYEGVLEAMQALEEQDLLSAGTLFSTEVQDTINAFKDSRTKPDDPESLRALKVVSLLAETFITQAIMNCLFKKLYRTSKGYIGSGKSTMQVGDQVWMLCGGRTPFILRPVLEDGTYTLIGETYLHGLMQGEIRVGNDRINNRR
jgi:hypothetical protein